MKELHYSPVWTAIASRCAYRHDLGAARIAYLISRTTEGYSYAPDPEAAPFLREAFAMAASGKSVRQVAAWLAERGVRGGRGTPVSVATVQRQLTEPFCAGFVRDPAGRLSPGRHEALVDGRTFALVQRRLMEKRCRPAKKNETLQPVG